MKKIFLTITIYILLIDIVSTLNQIAYDENIFDVWWATLIYVVAVYNTSYWLAESILKKQK